MARPAPATGLDRLATECGLIPDQRLSVQKGLAQKFSGVVTSEGAKINTLMAIGLIQAQNLARMMQDEELLRPLQALGDLEIHGELFSQNFYMENRPLVQQVQSKLPPPGSKPDQLFNKLIEVYSVRIRRYTLNANALTSDQFLHNERNSKYLTIYIFVHQGKKGVLLIPKKYVIALQSQDSKVRTEIFVSKRETDPPIMDPSLHENLKVCKKLLGHLQSFSLPLLQYCGKLLARYKETEQDLGLVGADFDTALASLVKLVQDLEGSDFGSGGEAALEALKRILGQVSPNHPICDICGEVPAAITLTPCNHYICENCMKLTVRSSDTDPALHPTGDMRLYVRCPYLNCQTVITKANLEQVSLEYYLQLLEQSEKHFGLKKCPSCQRLQSFGVFQSLICGHAMCNYCYTSKFGLDLKCAVDSRGLFRQDFMPDSVSGVCAGCGEVFKFKQTLGYTCTYQYGQPPDTYPTHGEYCNNCLFLSYRYGRCCKTHQLTESEKGYIESNLQLLPQCHSSHPRLTSVSEMLQQSSCYCALCKECALTRCTDLKCCFCKTLLDQTAADVIKRKMCCVCQQPKGDLLLRCGHTLHQRCVSRLMQQFIGSDNKVTCLICSAYIEPARIISALNGSALQQEFNKHFGYSFAFKCPKPGGAIYKFDLTENQDFPFQCECHKAWWYTLCGQPCVNQQEHKCKHVAFREAVDNMMLLGGKVGQCPVCFVPVSIVDAEYVQCEMCKNYLAPCCCARYEPIYYHGGAWHRPDCSKRDMRTGHSDQGPCTLCNGATCQKPMQLQRPRLIGPGES